MAREEVAGLPQAVVRDVQAGVQGAEAELLQAAAHDESAGVPEAGVEEPREIVALAEGWAEGGAPRELRQFADEAGEEGGCRRWNLCVREGEAARRVRQQRVRAGLMVMDERAEAEGLFLGL